jgi:hypothetical protein
VVGVRAGAEVRASLRLAFRDITILMSKSIREITKSPKKRAAATGDPVLVRVQPDMAKALDDWRRRQEDLPGRPEAIRRLVELGLTVKTSASPVGKPGRRMRARELAAEAIEKIIDPSAPPEERAQRRRRLTKGPLEFREDRVDLPKSKR